MNLDTTVIDEINLKKIKELKNMQIEKIIEEYINLCQPSKITVITDSLDDINYVRMISIKNKEEEKLKMDGHTVHFDGITDQARDKENTKILITPDIEMSKMVNTIDRDKGLDEVFSIMKGSMNGKEALIRFFCLGPKNSEFSILALQITDSAYVAHSEDILYRTGYEQFKNLKDPQDFFYLIHSAGELDDKGNTKNIKDRRIYIDITQNRVFTVNNQYAGNSLGLKKLALRLAIYKANNEEWLTEHMFIMGAEPKGKNRTTYFTGAYPSGCGKTSTAMIPNQKIVGDDIAYIRANKNGIPHAANVEQGIFGIIADVNPIDDPVIYKTLTTPRELIFSNVLVNNAKPYWLGMGNDLPKEGKNYSGQWTKGDLDSNGNEITAAHKNARYTVRIEELENADSKLHDPSGVPISGIIYGGRDSNTSVPVFQSLDWDHGVFIGATIESETTAATMGTAGVRKFNPMANLDFLVVQLGKYLNNHIKFGKKLQTKPLVFATNYFLKDNGKFLNDKVEKKVWLMWMEGRVHNEFDAIETPIGFIPKYEDLKILFKDIFDKDYSKEDYNTQFTIRIKMFLEKIERMEDIYKDEKNLPKEFTDYIKKIKERLIESKAKYKNDLIQPEAYLN